ncbi:hypothetical protein D9M68_854650 [compost metagenome]
MQRQKAGHQLGQHGLRQRDRAGHAQGAARFALHLGHRVGRGLGRFAQRLAMAQIGLADLGERELARGALQQAHTELRFQPGHAARQPRLGQAQRPASSREAAALHDLGEQEHVVQVLHGVSLG